ncbi:PNLIPRP1 isoform 10, partial [Pan troglodytes]
MLIFWTITLFLLGAAKGKEVCYEDLGCFSDTEPWGGTAIRPLKILPWSPEKIGTRFLLYTNENPNNFQILLLSDPSTIEASNFQMDRKTRFIIHGFIDKGDESWVTDMCKTEYSYPPSKVHLIDHSLGAHVAGEAGSKTPGLSRITVLDPVEASFESTPEEVRLDPSDADFVDVIHTDAAPLIPF